MSSANSLSKSSTGVPRPTLSPSKLAISSREKPRRTVRKPVSTPKDSRRIYKVDFGSFNTNTPEMNEFISTYTARFNAMYFGHAASSTEVIEANQKLEALISYYKQLERFIRLAIAKTIVAMKNDAKNQNIKLWY